MAYRDLGDGENRELYQRQCNSLTTSIWRKMKRALGCNKSWVSSSYKVSSQRDSVDDVSLIEYRNWDTARV